MINQSNKWQELILGAKMDPDFGPVILFGLGGIMTEVFKDKAIALPPLNRLLAATHAGRDKSLPVPDRPPKPAAGGLENSGRDAGPDLPVNE